MCRIIVKPTAIKIGFYRAFSWSIYRILRITNPGIVLVWIPTVGSTVHSGSPIRGIMSRRYPLCSATRVEIGSSNRGSVISSQRNFVIISRSCIKYIKSLPRVLIPRSDVGRCLPLFLSKPLVISTRHDTTRLLSDQNKNASPRLLVPYKTSPIFQR